MAVEINEKFFHFTEKRISSLEGPVQRISVMAPHPALQQRVSSSEWNRVIKGRLCGMAMERELV